MTPGDSGTGGKCLQELLRRRPTARLTLDFSADMLQRRYLLSIRDRDASSRLVRATCVRFVLNCSAVQLPHIINWHLGNALRRRFRLRGQTQARPFHHRELSGMPFPLVTRFLVRQANNAIYYTQSQGSHAVINLSHTSRSERLQRYLLLPGICVCILHHYRCRWELPRISRLIRDFAFDADGLRQLLLRAWCKVAVLGAGAQLEAKVYDHQEGETQHSKHSPLF